jgi:hypothetical protein
MGNRYESYALFVCNGRVGGYFSVSIRIISCQGNKNNDRKVTHDVVFNGFKEIKEIMGFVAKKTVH